MMNIDFTLLFFFLLVLGLPLCSSFRSYTPKLIRTIAYLRDDDFFEDDIEPIVDSQKRSKQRPIILNGNGKWNLFNNAFLSAIFVAGLGAGITIDSAINTNPRDLASRDAIDRNAPNPELCTAYGSSAMVLDERIFVTFNPFNVYVTQADTKPGCVLKPANVVNLLQKQRQLLSDEEVQGCKNGYNTWAFIGDINNRPQLTCVFQSDDAQNEFLSNPKIGIGEDVYEKMNKKSTANVYENKNKLDNP